MINMKLITICIGFFSLLLMFGCSTSGNPDSAATQSAPQVNARATSSSVDDGASNDQKSRIRVGTRNPVRIVVFQDKSRSVNQTRTTQLTEEDFLFLISLLRETSGELAFGIIDDTSNRPLLRLRINAPPTRPTEPVAGNAFERAEQSATYEEDLDAYNLKMQQWKAEIDNHVTNFMDRLKPMLQEKANAGRTSVYNAIARINLFFSESEASWPRPTHHLAVFNSDAIDTSHSKPVKLNDQVKLLLINGVGSTGIFGKSMQFESVQAALDFIKASENGGD